MDKQTKTIMLLHRCCNNGFKAFLAYVKEQRSLHPELEINTVVKNCFHCHHEGLDVKYGFTQTDLLTKAFIINEENVITVDFNTKNYT